jgi:hypothetical protein
LSKRVIARAARVMATATKRAIARAARVMAMATKWKEHAICMQASVKIWPFLAKVDLKMVEIARLLFDKEPLVLTAIRVFPEELLL